MVWASVSLVEGVDLMHSLGEMKITDPGDLYHFWTCRLDKEFVEEGHPELGEEACVDGRCLGGSRHRLRCDGVSGPSGGLGVGWNQHCLLQWQNVDQTRGRHIPLL